MSSQAVLIVDDDPMVRESLGDMLSDHGYGIHDARDGMSALALLHQWSISFMFSDIDMPDISGFELLARMQRDGLLVPTALMSARANEELLGHARSAGAVGLLSKPAEMQAVLGILEHFHGPRASDPTSPHTDDNGEYHHG